MSGAVFEPDEGVLELGHAELSVLARLAVAPTDTALHDHAVAAPVAALRASGLLGPGGIHPDVRPLAEVIGAPARSFDLDVDDHGRAHHGRIWVGAGLGVVGWRPSGAQRYALMGDDPAMLPELLVELVGPTGAVPPPVTGVRTLPAGSVWPLAAAHPSVEEVAAALGVPTGDRWAGALRDGLVAAGVRWRLRALRADDDATETLDVLDGGGAGVWAAVTRAGRTTVEATTTADVLARLARMLGS